MPLRVHDDRLTARIGTAALLLAVLITVFVVTLLDRLEKDGVQIVIYFGEVTAIAEGAPVMIAGREVGSLRSISLVRADTLEPDHPLYGTGGIAAVTRIDRDWAEQIPINAEFFVSARSAFAPRYIQIGPPPGGAAPARPLRPGDQIRGADPPSLDAVLQRMWRALDDTKRFIDAIRPASETLDVSIARLGLTVRGLETSPGELAALDTEIRETVREAGILLDGAARGRVDLDRLAEVLDRIERVVDRIDVALGEAQSRMATLQLGIRALRARLSRADRDRLGASIDQAEQAIADIEVAVSELRGSAAALARGGGTVTAFVDDMELIDQLKQMTKLLKTEPWKLLGRPPPPSSGL